MFKEPVEILPNVSYTACATLKVSLKSLYLKNVLSRMNERDLVCSWLGLTQQPFFFSIFKTQGSDSHYGTKGLKKVAQESSTGTKTTFFFFSSPGNNNGTSVEDGQIPEIIYYT